MGRLRGGVGLLACVAVVLWAGAAVQAAHSDQGCHNCHVPHQAPASDDPTASWGVPLWSTAQTLDGLPTFTMYSSETFNALSPDIAEQPDGASKLCLGCHDGSYIDESPDAVFGPNDLANSHPISFVYDSALASRHPRGGLKDPSAESSGFGGSIRDDLLDDHGKMQCTSCHDVHKGGIGTNMLRWDYNYVTRPKNDNVMCRVCHNK